MVLTLKGGIFALALLCFVGAFIFALVPTEPWRIRFQTAGFALLAVAWLLWSGGQ